MSEATVDPFTVTFEQLVDQLERTIERMASGAIGIEEATELYEHAGRLHTQAADRLASIQARIERLTGPPEQPAGG